MFLIKIELVKKLNIILPQIEISYLKKMLKLVLHLYFKVLTTVF